jgi:hypothetical protein
MNITGTFIDDASPLYGRLVQFVGTESSTDTYGNVTLYYLDFGAINNTLSWLIGVDFDKFSLYYGNKYFYSESAILAGYSFKFLNSNIELFGGYYIDSTDFAIIFDALSEKWNLNLSYVKSLISASLIFNSWNFSGNYSLLNKKIMI